MRRFSFVISSVFLALTGGCSGDSNQGDGSTTGGQAGNGSGKASAASCYKQCEAQTDVMGCTPIVNLADCKQLCDGLAAGVKAGCADEFDAYYTCSANDGFMCALGLVAQKTSACMAAQDAYNRCQNGGMKLSCTGATASGVCPSVQCPCKTGTKLVSGFEQSGSSCRCYDTTTCVDFFCD